MTVWYANHLQCGHMLQVEILKLELKKEKLMEQIILQSLKSKIAIRRDLRTTPSY